MSAQTSSVAAVPILASLLPGFREMRVHVAVGALWMVTAALLMRNWIHNEAAASTVGSDFVAAWSHLPVAGQGLALGFAAYLVGAATTLSRVPTWLDQAINVRGMGYHLHEFGPQLARRLGGDTYAMRRVSPKRAASQLDPFLLAVLDARWDKLSPRLQRGIRRLVRRVPRGTNSRIARAMTTVWSHVATPWSPPVKALIKFLAPPKSDLHYGRRLNVMITSMVERACGDDLSAVGVVGSGVLSPYTRRSISIYLDHAYLARFHRAGDLEYQLRQRLSDAIVSGLESDFASIGHRLQVQNAELHDRFDRTAAEAELRLGVAPPLAAICLAASIAYMSPWPLLGLAFPAILFVHGWKKRYEADAVVWSAVVYQLVEIPELVNLEGLRLSETMTVEERWTNYEEAPVSRPDEFGEYH
jgi:hypothetical protein